MTQLYVSVDASTKESLKKIDRPLFRDFWPRFLDSLEALGDKVNTQFVKQIKLPKQTYFIFTGNCRIDFEPIKIFRYLSLVLNHVPHCLIQGQRTVYRLTLVKAWNTDEIRNYAELVARGRPDFIEVKVWSYYFMIPVLPEILTLM